MSEYAFTTPQCHIEAYIKEIPPNYPIAQWAIDIGIFNPETDAWLVSITVGNVTNAINLRKSGIGSKVLDDFESTCQKNNVVRIIGVFQPSNDSDPEEVAIWYMRRGYELRPIGSTIFIIKDI